MSKLWKAKQEQKCLHGFTKWTKVFFVLDKTEIVQDKIFVQGWKLHFLLSKVMQNEYLSSKIGFQSGNFILNDFLNQKMYFLNLDKIFVLDNFSFVQD